MKNIVVLISGSGSNLQAIIDACGRKQINGTLRAVFSNKADAFGLERARAAGIGPRAGAKSVCRPGSVRSSAMHEIDAYAPDLVVLAGYMRILSPAVCQPLSGTTAEHPPFVTAEVSGLHTHRQVLVTRSMGPRCTSSPMSWMAVRLSCRPKCRSLLATARKRSRRGYRPGTCHLSAGESAGSSRASAHGGQPRLAG